MIDGAHAVCFQVSSNYADGLKKSALSTAVTTIRERERFTQSLTLAYCDGRTAILTDGS